MTKLITKKKISGIIMLFMLTTTIISCGKDEEASTGYPRNVNVEYRVTSSNVRICDVLFRNETGSDGFTNLDDVTVPYTVKFSKSVKQFDSLAMSVTASAAGTLTVEILVDGKVVKTDSFTGNNIISGSSVYLFE